MKLSVVSSLFYSESYIEEFYSRLKQCVLEITDEYEIILVNDGSPDNSLTVALKLQEADSRISVIDLSRNFGHHKAIMTGLSFATGDYVFLIDIDLEEEPESLISLWNEIKSDPNCDVVFGIQKQRKGGFIERCLGDIFYKTFSLLSDTEYPPNTLTARIMNKKYVSAILCYKEKSLDIWGVFALAGFNQKGVSITKKSKGTTTYTFIKKIKMALESITSLSHKPLYFIFIIGAIFTALSFINICIILVNRFYFEIQVEGWASIIATIWLIGGLIMFMLGIIGIYLSKMFLELKNRPLTVIKEIYRKNET